MKDKILKTFSNLSLVIGIYIILMPLWNSDFKFILNLIIGLIFILPKIYLYFKNKKEKLYEVEDEKE